MSRFALCLCVVFSLLLLNSPADPPATLDYQGKILISDLPLTGTGYFKFALANSGGTSNYWSNDGTSPGEPGGSVTGTVYNGVFSVTLGDSSMSAIDTSIFNAGVDLYLRTWFSEDNSAFDEMLPAQPLSSVAYALNANQVDGMDASEIIQTATNSVVLSGDVTGPAGNNQIGTNTVGTSEIQNGSVASNDINWSTFPSFLTSESDPIFTAVSNNIIYSGDSRLNGFNPINTVTAATPNSSLSLIGQYISITDYAPTAIVFNAKLRTLNNVVWVSTNGTPAGPGDIDTPFDTVSAGYNAAAVKFAGEPATLVIASGTYTGAPNQLVMAAGNVHILGFGRPQIESLQVISASTGINGKQRIENIIVKGVCVVVVDQGSDVKFHNTRMEGGLQIMGPRVEVQDCFAVADDGSAIVVGSGGSPIQDIAIYNTSAENNSAAMATLDVAMNVGNFEVIGCEIYNRNIGPAIWDHETAPITPLHLYSHNYIRGPTPGAGPIAFDSDATGPGSTTIALHQNTIYGDVGATVGIPFQIYANNTIYGTITWIQAATGSFDQFNNSYISNAVALPGSWKD